MRTAVSTIRFLCSYSHNDLGWTRRSLPTSLIQRPLRFYRAPAGKDPQLSQGPAHEKDDLHHNDPQSQSAQAGKSQKNSNSPLDAASSKGSSQQKAQGGSGNPESIGMVDQVGSQSGTAKITEKGDGEEKAQ